jgi:hypothetical protein
MKLSDMPVNDLKQQALEFELDVIKLMLDLSKNFSLKRAATVKKMKNSEVSLLDKANDIKEGNISQVLLKRSPLQTQIYLFIRLIRLNYNPKVRSIQKM